MRALTADNKELGFLALLSIVALAGATILAGAESTAGLSVALGLAAAVIALLRTEMAIYFLIVAMLLSPELVLGQTQGGTLKRPVTLRLDDFLLFIIFGTWFLKNALYKELNLIRKTPLNGAMWFYSFACILATLVGVMAGRVEFGSGFLYVLKYIEYFLIYWMVINITTEESQVRRFLSVMLVVGIIVSIVAIMQIPTGRRVSAPFEGAQGEPNTLGGYLLLMLAVFLGPIFASRSYRKILMTVLAIMFLPFLYTLSRASYLGFVPVALTLPPLVRKGFLMIAVTVLGLGLVVFPGVLPVAVKERIEFTFTQRPQQAQMSILGKRVDTSTSARLEMFNASMDAFLDKPLVGWGVTGWRFVDSQYFRTLVETGILGLLSFLYLMYRVLQMAFQSREHFRERDPFYFGLCSGFIAGTLGLLVHAVGSNTFIIVRIMEPFWMLCALLYVLPGVTRRKVSPEA